MFQLEFIGEAVKKEPMEVFFYNPKIREFCWNTNESNILDAINSIAVNEFSNGSNSEKLANSKIFSIRYNLNERMIYRYFYPIINNEKKRAILILDLIGHNYNKIKNYNSKILKSLNIEMDVSEKTKEEIKIHKVKNFVFNDATIFYNASQDNYLILSRQQKEAEELIIKSPPVIIEGSPGSGKTTVLCAVLKNKLQAMIEMDVNKNFGFKPILYIVKSPYLINLMQKELNGSPEFDGVDISRYVIFLTYQQLFSKLILLTNSKVKHEELQNDKSYFNVFKAWFEKKNSTPKIGLKQIYEEFRIASGHTRETYIKCGIKQSTIEAEERDILYAKFEVWLKYLKSEGIYVSDFYDLKSEIGLIGKLYSLILVDEAQDLSHIQLRNLIEFAFNNGIIFSIDQGQNISDSNSKSAYLKNILYHVLENTHQSLEIINLAESYRCAKAVMKFALIFNQLRIDYTPLGKSEHPINLPSHEGGKVFWINPKNIIAITKLNQDEKDNANICVVAPREKFDTARKVFSDVIQIFTPDEIKGLGYKKVIFFMMLQNEIIYELNTEMGKDFWVRNSKYSTVLAECFVAITRAEDEIYVYEDDQSHKIKNIVNKLKVLVTQNEKKSEEKKELLPQSISQAWEKKANELIERGLNKQAFDILTQKLGKTLEEAERFLVQFYQNDDKEITLKLEQKNEIANKSVIPVKKYNKKKKNEILVHESKDDLNNTPKNSESSQRKVMKFSKIELKKLLLKNGLNIKNTQYQFWLHQAIMVGDTKSVKILINQGFDINLEDSKGCRPLHVAIQHRKIDILKILISESEIEINFQNAEGMGPLHLACAMNNEEIVASLLLHKKIDVNETISSGTEETALHIVVMNGFEKLCMLLLKHPEIDVNAKNIPGFAPIHLAVQLNSPKILASLLQHKRIIMNQLTLQRANALHFAITNADNADMVRLLLNKCKDQIDINVQANGYNDTPLMIAMSEKCFNIAAVLLENNAEYESKILSAPIEQKNSVWLKYFLDKKPENFLLNSLCEKKLKLHC